MFFFTTAKCVNKEALYLPEGSSISPATNVIPSNYLSNSVFGLHSQNKTYMPAGMMKAAFSGLYMSTSSMKSSSII